MMDQATSETEKEWNKAVRETQLSKDTFSILQNIIDWNDVSQYQILSEEFITEFKDKVN